MEDGNCQTLVQVEIKKGMFKEIVFFHWYLLVA